MFSFFKQKFVFSISHSTNINSETISDAGQLINYVIGVNNDLFDNEEEGFLVIKKDKVTKKGYQPIFAMEIELPILEDNPYFTEVLNPFYSKKPINFDETILPQELDNITMNNNLEDEVQELSEELRNLASNGEDFLNKDESLVTKTIVDNTLEEPSEILEENVSEEDTKELLIAEYQQKVAKLEQSLQIKEDEIIQIKQSKSTINSEESRDKKEIVINHNELSYTEIVQRSIQQELLKLEEEVLNMDKTDNIIQETKIIYDSKKEEKIEEVVTLLEAKKRISLERAEEKYNKRINEIESAFIDDKTNQISEIRTSLNEECKEETQKRISKQQDKINHFIDERKRELNSWQKNISLTIEKGIQSLN